MNTEYNPDNMTMAPWVEIESTNLAAVAYLAEQRALLVRFKTNEKAIWLYQDVPQETYDEFMAAPSKGSYFAKNIRSKFESQQFLIPEQAEPVRDDNGKLHPMEAASHQSHCATTAGAALPNGCAKTEAA